MTEIKKQPLARKLQLDVQDLLLAAGVLLIEAGVAAYSIPVASILLGLFALAGVWLIETTKRQTRKTKERTR
jgi:hypothetical protein